MSPVLDQTALLLTGLMLASVASEAPLAIDVSEIEIRPSVAYGTLALLAVGSLLVGLWYPEQIAAAFGQT